jgi:hypothetical protein
LIERIQKQQYWLSRFPELPLVKEHSKVSPTFIFPPNLNSNISPDLQRAHRGPPSPRRLLHREIRGHFRKVPRPFHDQAGQEADAREERPR